MISLLAPKTLQYVCGNYWQYFLGFALIILLPTFGWIFLKIPADFQQGIVAKIIYIHVPSAILSLGLFFLIGVFAGLFLVYKIKIAPLVIRSILPIGLMSTIIVLITGAIWGKPTWGTWWIWDARLTSELILAFIYFMIYSFDKTMQHLPNSDWIVSVLSLFGLLDLPIIHYSVTWWHTLHQGPSILAFQKPTIAWPMLWPLILVIIGICFLTLAILMLRCYVIIATNE